MLYREIIADCSQIHKKHINTLCGQNVELLNVKMAVHTVTTGLYSAFPLSAQQCSTNIQSPSFPAPFLSKSSTALNTKTHRLTICLS